MPGPHRSDYLAERTIDPDEMLAVLDESFGLRLPEGVRLPTPSPASA